MNVRPDLHGDVPVEGEEPDVRPDLHGDGPGEGEEPDVRLDLRGDGEECPAAVDEGCSCPGGSDENCSNRLTKSATFRRTSSSVLFLGVSSFTNTSAVNGRQIQCSQTIQSNCTKIT